MSEKVIIPVKAETLKSTRCDKGRYESLYKSSTENPEDF